MAFAFQCKNCGHLETSANAGERDFPAACRICGYGVTFDPIRGTKTHLDADNWIVLSELEADAQAALAESHGVEVAELIEVHVPAPASEPTRDPQSIERTAEESLVTQDVAS